nr:F-box only protein 28 [Leptinotarsa decemlineata]
MSGSPLLYLPDVALEKIFSFLSYDELAKNRIVCTRFNQVCGNLLSRGFIQLDKRHSAIFKKLKSMLPRRESERRAHPLSRHCDILQAVETRISMLNMTYIKFIEMNVLCFIPGKVLDEIKSVLNLVERDQAPPRTHQLLQELRDLSSMAMEHFDEHILPTVKELVVYRTVKSYECVTATNSKKTKSLYAPHVLSNELHRVKKQSKTHKHHISYLTQSTQKLCEKLGKLNTRLKGQSQKIREQEKKIQEQNTKIQEQEATLADIKKHMDDWDQKYKDLTTELVRARDDILSATSHRLNPDAQTPPSPPKLYKTNIKPRVTHILPKSYLGLQMDLDRKRKSNLLPEIPLKRNKAAEDNEKDDLNLNLKDLTEFKDESTEEVESKNPEISSILSRSSIELLVSNTLDNFLKSPLASINSRKRKMAEDIDLK